MARKTIKTNSMDSLPFSSIVQANWTIPSDQAASAWAHLLIMWKNSRWYFMVNME
jgi:hypothetical protein